MKPYNDDDFKRIENDPVAMKKYFWSVGMNARRAALKHSTTVQDGRKWKEILTKFSDEVLNNLDLLTEHCMTQRKNDLIIEEAMRVFGNKNKASSWLHNPQALFDGRTPFQMLITEAGREAVKEMLGQIDHGMVG